MHRIATWAGTSGRLLAQTLGGGAAICRPPAVTASREGQTLRRLLTPMTPPLGIRTFAAVGRKPKVDDGTLEGRYATALFMASSDRLDKVYQDLVGIRDMMQESAEFRLMVETPGIDPDSKTAALEDICSQVDADEAIINFLKVLIENKRMYKLGKMIELFEGFYRAEKGLVLCEVTSAEPLSSTQEARVKAALEQRAEQGATLLMEYKTNPALLGGLVVKLGDAILDQSVSTRLERMTTQLMAPVS
mmetsp:Transcript_89983/g.178860  ORF Transcript_89983/g.178860 Transcript_89983/m.178860 type:complete len:247 (+) Transcript_89983:47-787(+)